MDHVDSRVTALHAAGSSRPRSNTSSTGACSRRWVTRNRSGTRPPPRFTGVRGLMQLTEDTAAIVRAGDRLDARASIFGGAKYLSRLLATIPRPYRRSRSHVAGRRGLQRRSTDISKTHASSRSSWPKRRTSGRTSVNSCRCLSQERWYTRRARLCARLGTRPLRGERAGLPQHPRRWPGRTSIRVGPPPEPAFDTPTATGKPTSLRALGLS